MLIKPRRRPFSLASRLTLFISLTTIVAFFVFAWIMVFSVEQHFGEQDKDDLKQIGNTLADIISKTHDPDNSRLEQISNAVANDKNIFIYLETDKNKVIYQSAAGPDFKKIIKTIASGANINANRDILWRDDALTSSVANNGEMDSASYRIIALPVSAMVNGAAARYRLLIALSVDFHLHYIQTLKYKLLIAALLFSMIIILVVLAAVYQGHAPLRKVSRKIQSITSENLHTRLVPTDVPIELEQLILSFNHMIERIEDVFTRQSNFSADIAHEIRTPITNLVTQTEITLSQTRSVKEYQDVLYSNLEEFSRMSKMVSDMLFLAQADNNLLIPECISINLKTEIIKVFDFFDALAEERGVALQFAGGPATVTGDPLMLRRVISNLLSNAIRYTAAGHTVTVSVSETANDVQLVVANPGTP